ncbi:NEDD8 ultimate buster 1 [Tetrabaena socialis]|uniref:NEDD8 ultimate buster 1 n=1 Tax=Tetrabaena socialis TaxID=47790 RepID=A0A2J8A8B9_9CHLO|nr:NEDD8 ultimate buster 1 [Tetrabaena socialis]|eukprot:PNH08776.1 NEDD8 ultimate buster 1 [Tetrabaena socialis]
MARDIGGLGLKVTGALGGTVYVESIEATVGSLRAEVSRLIGGDAVVKLIVGGRTLQDDSRTLQEAGLTPASRILVTRGAAADTGAATASAVADRARRLERVRQAAEALAGRDSRGLSDDYALDIENQFGASVIVNPEDRRNLVFGLVMHDKAKATLARGDHAAALEELLLAEEALALCNPALTSAVDNVPLLLLDLVWCCYKLGDVRRLAVGRERLAKARAGLARAHGPALERLRTLTGSSFSPELATYLRLEVLEGLVAYYGGENRATAESCFRAAQAKWQRLQVSDEALAILQHMGYGLQESRRGLRFSGGDMSAAVDFIQEQRKASQERESRRQQLHDWNHERIKYGKTTGGQYVDPKQLDRLAALGYERPLAAEALRRNDNGGQAALDELSKPERRKALELELLLKQGLQVGLRAVVGDRPQTDPGGASGATATAAAAAAAAEGPNSATLAALKVLAEAFVAAKKQPAAAAGGGGAAAGASGAAGAAGAGAAAPMEVDAGAGAEGGAGGPEDAEAEAAEDEAAEDEAAEDEAAEDEAAEEAKEAEKDLLRYVQSDPMAAYDIDVSDEGDIIATFLTMMSTGAAAAEPTAPGSAGDAASKAFAVAMARVADDVKCTDIVVLDVAPAAALPLRDPAQDFGDVVLHLFTAEQREFYDIESFYAAAEEVELPFGPEGSASEQAGGGAGQGPTWSTKL